MPSKNPPVKVSDYGTCGIGESAYKDLFPVSGQPIVKLCKKNSRLLVFPNSLGVHDDAIDKDEKSICSITSKSDTEGEWELHTGDILGFVGRGGTELTIHSRFAASDENDFFLHYIVQKVFKINLFNLKHSTAEDRVFDFLLCLFPKYLKDALKQGLYKQYVVNKYNDSNVRGMIDVARHIKRNIPFAGKIAYNVREYSYDNDITQLIRHTIEYIRSSNMSKVLKQDKDTIAYVSQICEATPSYRRQDMSRIVSKNLKAPTSPYYLGYIPLQKLCVQILTHKKIKYGDNNDEPIYGLLFVGYWLWEEYLYEVVLKDRELGFIHSHNLTYDGGIDVFKEGKHKFYPDYRRDDFILDAKYKPINNIDADDHHQVISYMYLTKALKGGFIYPVRVDSSSKRHEIEIKRDELNGYGGNVHTIGVPIPSDAPDYDAFEREMKRIENDLRDKIAMTE